MLTLAVHDTTGCECGGRGAQLGSLLPLTGATSSAATLPGAYAQALDAAALPQATRVAFGPCQYLAAPGADHPVAVRELAPFYWRDGGEDDGVSERHELVAKCLNLH